MEANISCRMEEDLQQPSGSQTWNSHGSHSYPLGVVLVQALRAGVTKTPHSRMQVLLGQAHWDDHRWTPPL
jgi:hypothetical protein